MENLILDIDLNVSIDLAKETYESFKSIHNCWVDFNISQFELNYDVLVIVGIGGSYSGIKAAATFFQKENIVFLGNNLDSLYINRELTKLNGKRILVNVISSSGNTIEVLVGYNLLKEYINKNKIEANFYLTTSNKESYLYREAIKQKYPVIELNPNLVGRYSTLFVGALAFNFMKLDINNILNGAKKALESDQPFIYASIRNKLKSKSFEVIQIYEDSLFDFVEWLKQLFCESEGKNGEGIFLSSALFTKDLHSLGQYLQEGRRDFFQTTLFFNEDYNLTVSSDLEFINKKVSYLNYVAMKSTVDAHREGGIHNILFNLNKKDEYNFGFLINFFHKACVASSLLQKLNPYDNQGVSHYKSKIKSILK